MNKIDLNKKIQKFISRTVLLGEVEVRVAKKLHNAIRNYEDEEEVIAAQMKSLDDNNLKNVYEKIIDELEEVENDQNIRIIRLKQQLKILEKKITCLQNILLTEDHLISESDRKNSIKKSLRLLLLKICSGIHIDENTPPNVIRGFSMVKCESFSIKPFEFNLLAISQEERMDKMWDLVKCASNHISEWDELFSTP